MKGGAATADIKTADEGEEIDQEETERERLRKSAHRRAVSFACAQNVNPKTLQGTSQLDDDHSLFAEAGRRPGL